MNTRRDFLAAAGTASVSALAVGATGVPAAAAGPVILDEAAFRAHSASTAKHRQAIGAARANDGSPFQYAVNTLNGFQSGWGEPASAVQIAVVLFGSSCALALDDAAWKAHGIMDIIKRLPSEYVNADASQSNPWSHASATLSPTSDRSIPALLRRGVRIYVCNTALGALATSILAAGTAAGAGSDVAAIQAHLRERVVPGIQIVPAGISSVAVLQETGYTYFSAAL